MQTSVDRPLRGIYVLDFLHTSIAALGRLLAELGADVVRIEPPGGLPDRVHHDDLAGWLDFAVANIGKRTTQVDMANREDQSRLHTMLAQADVVLLDATPGATFPLNPADIRAARPQCVVVSVSDFGRGEYNHWQVTDALLHALSGGLSRSGFDGMRPLLPPEGVAEGCAAAQGLWVTVSALYHALRTGSGDHLDFSVLDGAIHACDPGFGVGGSAALGARPSDLPPGRPARGFWYPILRCADGQARFCVLAPRQWDSFYDWMGRPEAFADQKYRDMYTRLGCAELWAFIEAFIADKTRAELEREGEARGIPIAGLLSLTEVVEHGHLVARGAMAEWTLPDSRQVKTPSGTLVIDGARMTPSRGVPALDGDDDGLPLQERPVWPHPEANSDQRPFAGLKVLDLGVIVAGAEAGRLLADLGADVIKVESRQSPDATRRPLSGLRMVASCAAGHRNKRGLGLNLKDPRGREYFLALAEKADVILSNFKPGTLEKMGLSYEEIAKVNPRIVMADSSAFGSTGPLAGRMGYGPLVRAMSGLATGWRYPEDESGYADQVVVYPDHVAGRFVAAGAVALMIRALRTGRGGSASVAQLELILGHLAPSVARHSAGVDIRPPDLPWNVYQAQGDDNWLVVTVRNQSEWETLTQLIGRPELATDARFRTSAARRENQDTLDAEIAQWAQIQDANRATRQLQNGGVPAGPMLRITELPDWPRHRQRGLFRTETHPLLEEPLIMETAPVSAANMATPDQRPAPERGEHTREVLQEWLEMEETAINRLIEADVFEEIDPAG